MSTFATSMEKVSSLSSDSQILRAQWHDYRAPGFYLITMVANDRDAAPFGSLAGDSEDTATVRLSAVGEALDNAIIAIPDYYPEIEIVEHVVMEDHCHICLQVKTPMQKHLGAVVGMLKNLTTKVYINALNTNRSAIHFIPQVNSRDAKRQQERIHASLKLAKLMVVGDDDDVKALTTGAQPLITKQAGKLTAADVPFLVEQAYSYVDILRRFVSKGYALEDIPVTTIPPLWQEGYHDRIVTRYGQIATQRRYIRRNAARLWLKRHSDRQLTRVRDLHLPLSLALAQRLKDTATYWDQRRDVQHSQFSQRHDGTHYSETYLQLVQKFLRKRLVGNSVEPFLRLRACGNMSLLMSGRPLVAVRISRSVTREQFLQERARILDLCEREGAIAISPFRSWSEKAVLTALRQNGYAHIIMHGESMWDGWKPQDGSTATHHQQVPEWFSAVSASDPGDMSEVYAGRCLFLALWPDRPRGERATKADCEVMNELCRVLGMRDNAQGA